MLVEGPAFIEGSINVTLTRGDGAKLIFRVDRPVWFVPEGTVAEVTPLAKEDDDPGG